MLPKPGYYEQERIHPHREDQTVYSGPIINIHTHLRLKDDMPSRVANWRKWNLEKVVCLSTHPRWKAAGYCINEDYPAIMKQYPDLIVGFAGVNLVADEVDEPDTLDQLKEQGFEGLKFEDNSYPYNHDLYWPLYERAEQLELPILFHTGYLAPLMREECNYDARDRIDAENMRPYLLDRVARSFPKLKMVGAHLGLPHAPEALTLMCACENVYFDFSGGSGQKMHLHKILRAMMPPAGLEIDWADPAENQALVWFEKLCFGTDNPEPDVWVPASEYIMDALQIPDSLRRKFYYDNAARVLGLAGA